MIPNLLICLAEGYSLFLHAFLFFIARCLTNEDFVEPGFKPKKLLHPKLPQVRFALDAISQNCEATIFCS